MGEKIAKSCGENPHETKWFTITIESGQCSVETLTEKNVLRDNYIPT